MRRAAIALMLGCTFGCVPWTVRPIDNAESGSQGARFDAARYVDSIWDAKLLPAIDGAAVELAAALQRSQVRTWRCGALPW